MPQADSPAPGRGLRHAWGFLWGISHSFPLAEARQAIYTLRPSERELPMLKLQRAT